MPKRHQSELVLVEVGTLLVTVVWATDVVTPTLVAAEVDVATTVVEPQIVVVAL